MRRLLLCFLFELFSTMLLLGQTYSKEDTSHQWWGSIGGGIGVGSKVMGYSFRVSLNYLISQNLYSVRYVEFQNYPIGFLGNDPNESSPIRDITEGAALYGICTRKQDYYISASAGIGVIQRKNADYLGGEEKTSLGIALEAQTFWKPFLYCGIGISGFANINSEKTLLGLLLCLQVGNL